MPVPFTVDHAYDRARASDGVSRYGHYLREAVAADHGLVWGFEDETDRQHAFAALAWRTATGPVMAPGYVRYHHLILGAEVYRSSWDGALLASVQLATSPPAGLARMRQWADWPTELRGEHYVPVGPYEQQIGHRSDYQTGYALTTVSLEFGLHDVMLPPPPATPTSRGAVYVGRDTIEALVEALNIVVAPILDVS
ncbi:hypothetical protein ACQPZP_40935 [Spirillospora sp. CA-142024]|uniref:hypothetical protein n=1 Tax=Spirillospora sp. CA-142024 TaxID=3240036 RepID=UPI003D8F6163